MCVQANTLLKMFRIEPIKKETHEWKPRFIMYKQIVSREDSTRKLYLILYR